MKIKLLLIAIITFIINGCYSSMSIKNNETYAQSHYDVDIYINYNFVCSHCYYEMYWCFNCKTYHVHIRHWCNNHYHWYNNWYRVHYYYPRAYYYGHWHNHYYYRDVTRHYIRDNNGLRNLRTGRVNNITKTREYKNSNVNKKYDIRLKEKTYKIKNDINKNETKTYQKRDNIKQQNIKKLPIRKNSDGRNVKKR